MSPKHYVIFVNYHEFTGSSGIHIYHLGRHLPAAGVDVAAYIPGRPASVQRFGPRVFDISSFSIAGAVLRIRRMRGRGARVLLHAWTPRERVRKFVQRVSQMTGTPYYVHLEDNELHIRNAYAALQPPLSVKTVYQRWKARQGLADPDRMQPFMAGAAGITYLTERLADHCPPGVPQLLFWPGCEDEFFNLPLQSDARVREGLGIASGEFVIVYPGNAHPANIEDMKTLYGAVQLLYGRGVPVRLVRIGNDHRTAKPAFGASAKRPWLTHLGDIPASELAHYIKAADALVQPGRADDFNDYRFPSKLTLFLASGRPVILPRANVGRAMRDGVECLLLETGAADEIALKLQMLIANAGLSLRIGERGRAFANTHFRWPAIAGRMAAFYRETQASLLHA